MKKTCSKEIQALISNPAVKYLYHITSELFGIDAPEFEHYIIIIDKDIELPKDIDFKLFYMDDWFEKINKNQLITWMCACLPKKYILKEYVKLLLSTKPIELRKNLENELRNVENNDSITKKDIFLIICNANFVYQILSAHKIVKFDNCKRIWNKIPNECDNWYFWITKNSDYPLVMNMTQGIYEKYIENLYLNKQKNDI